MFVLCGNQTHASGAASRITTLAPIRQSLVIGSLAVWPIHSLYYRHADSESSYKNYLRVPFIVSKLVEASEFQDGGPAGGIADDSALFSVIFSFIAIGNSDAANDITRHRYRPAGSDPDELSSPTPPDPSPEGRLIASKLSVC
ncbi:hypothetical protein EVAR_49599_1 [Eumeta japonica]|uniref:Uncharacterized protein n=1 Tax=Eumeta variegata TaxID=151549 RepID=A0A4C1Y3A3_EUMVA|nr:hypothetical protein EVAR_49599_1 [Eumeta japonica]